MRNATLSFVGTVALVLVTSLAHGDETDDARAQVEFGNKVARQALWDEAIYRWKRATELDPTYSAAWNNLGIAYEQKGLFDDALDAYEEALDLSPDDINIQQNYDLFMEIYDRISEVDR